MESHLKIKPLPPLWKVEAGESGLHILKYSGGEARVVQRSVFWNFTAGKLKVFVHGRELPPTHAVYTSLKNINLSKRDVESFVANLHKIISEVRIFDVCTGVTKLKYKKFWTGDDCMIDHNQFHEIRYQLTCRSTTCLGIVNQCQRHCASCANLSKKFSDRV